MKRSHGITVPSGSGLIGLQPFSSALSPAEGRGTFKSFQLAAEEVSKTKL